METVAAPLVVQLSVDCCPGWMLRGLASKRMICGVPAEVTGGLTVTVAVAVILPAGATAVRVYVVVVAGVTVVEPVAATLPTPLSMETLVAPCTNQVNVELWPALIVLGLASKRTIVAEAAEPLATRSEEHTSELQSLRHLVC